MFLLMITLFWFLRVSLYSMRKRPKLKHPEYRGGKNQGKQRELSDH